MSFLSFFIKRPRVVVDCFTANTHAYELFPLAPAIQSLPTWHRDCPSTIEKNNNNSNALSVPIGTAKGCRGIIELYKTAWTLPLWTDTELETQGQGCRYQFADGVSTLTWHPPELANMAFQDLVNIKLIAPWALESKSDCNWTFIEPFWNKAENYSIPPGIIDFKYQHNIHVNVFLNKDTRYSWNAGKPMAHLIPLTEKAVDVRCHLVDANEFHKRTHANLPFFVGAYHKSRKILECPVKNNNQK